MEELQDAVDDPQLGYQTHHIVEGQYDSIDPDSNARRFGRARLDSRANLVRIPRWKHVAISSWYSTKNEGYDNQTPREWLRGKGWDDQYKVGIDALREVGVLQ